MAINREKLQNVVTKPDGNVTARCPACAASGADTKGEHLIVYPDGRFGCVANPKDKDHNKAVLLLAGDSAGGKTARSIPKLEIRPQKIEASQRLMVLGQIGQENPTPEPNRSVQPDSTLSEQESGAEQPTDSPVSVEPLPHAPSPSPAAAEANQPVLDPGSIEEAKAFLLRKPVGSPSV